MKAGPSVFTLLKDIGLSARAFCCDALALFRPLPIAGTTKQNHILIFNWRDSKHVWAGGAEVYVQEIGKRLVSANTAVTIFCGNDYTQPAQEVMDGMTIIRRGGFYTLYVWAPLYYLFKLRKIATVVIDSENGIPFFTPIFVHKPKILLIHHIHQEVFRTQLTPFLALIAHSLECWIMPIVYRSTPIITVSPSSRADIAKLFQRNEEAITVITPGVMLPKSGRNEKTRYPSILYVGRLKPYKRIDRAIAAFRIVKQFIPDAKLTIAGSGEALDDLKAYAKALHVSVTFLGYVSETTKHRLYQTHWLMVQPSQFEGWGITVIEANAHGTPVVATNVKGLRDSVRHGKTGLLVKQNSTKRLALAMGLLCLDHNLRKQLSKDAQQWASQWTWENSGQQLQTYLERMMPVTRRVTVAAISQ